MSVTPVLEADVLSLRGRTPSWPTSCSGRLDRQATTLQLIAAENFTSPAVLAALGSPLANKYAEGYPGARHHGGCEIVDVAERLAVERAKALFGAEHANVQSHSGLFGRAGRLRRPAAPRRHRPRPRPALRRPSHPRVARQLLRPLVRLRRLRGRRGDRAHRPRAGARPSPVRIAPRPSCAGPSPIPGTSTTPSSARSPTRWAPTSSPTPPIPSGSSPGERRPIPCRTPTSCAPPRTRCCAGRAAGCCCAARELAERVDRAVFPFTQGGAQMHTIAAKAVAFGEAATPAFTAYAHQVVANARVLAAGLAAEGLVVTTGGTDTHLITVDPAPLGVDGRTARGRLAAAGMVLDCCALPHGGRPWPAARHGGADHTGHGRGGDGADRRPVRGGAAGRRGTPGGRVKKCGTWPEDFRRIRG